MDFLEHFEHGLVGAAVERTPQGADAGRGGGEEVGAAGGDHAHGGGGAVLLVIGVEQENQVERLDDFRLQLAVLAGVGEHHVEEVRGVFESGFRIDGGQAVGLAVGIGGDGADLGDEAGGVPGEALLALVDDVGMVGGGRVDHRREDGHRVRGGREAVEEVAHVLVQHLVFREQVGELGELRAAGKIAVDEQVGGLDEGAFFRQFRDVVAAVAQDAFFAVDEGDGALAGTGVAVAGIERDAAGLVSEREDVDPHFALGADDGLQFEQACHQ